MCSREYPARRHKGAPTFVSPTKCHTSLPRPTVPDSSLTIDNSTWVSIIPYSTITTCESNAASMRSWNGYLNASALVWWEKEVFYAIIFPPHENILAIFFEKLARNFTFSWKPLLYETRPSWWDGKRYERWLYLKDRRYTCNIIKTNLTVFQVNDKCGLYIVFGLKRKRNA